MKHLTLLPLVVALGMRHGFDPDHLTAIDAMARLRSSRWNGVLFALGHGVLVTLLAVGFGGFLARVVGPYTPWLLILLGVVNLSRLCLPRPHRHAGPRAWAKASPLLLGILFGAGFETASQLSALVIAAEMNAWLLGALFAAGMLLVDGCDGYLAARTQSQALAGGRRALKASRLLGVFVVASSFALGFAELLKVDIDRLALPLGAAFFVGLVALRLWSLRDPASSVAPSPSAPPA
jgi:nickel/cobalt transporter (NiCoT) family protein